MSKTQILLVEDEAALAMVIKETLEALDFDVDLAVDGEEGLKHYHAHRPQVIVADVMMPRMDGFEMVRRIRETDRQTAVLFLTARTAVSDVVEGFRQGGNDYLRKPFSMQELIVRIRALVERMTSQTDPGPERGELLSIGRYRLNVATQQLTIGNEMTVLSYRETHILRLLIEKKGEVVTMHDILMELWGDDNYYNSRSLHVFITKLRHKLAADSRITIINARGIGYKLCL